MAESHEMETYGWWMRRGPKSDVLHASGHGPGGVRRTACNQGGLGRGGMRYTKRRPEDRLCGNCRTSLLALRRRVNRLLGLWDIGPEVLR